MCSGKQYALEIEIYVILLVDVETMEMDNIIQDNKPVESSEKEASKRTLVITNLRSTGQQRR